MGRACRSCRRPPPALTQRVGVASGVVGDGHPAHVRRIARPPHFALVLRDRRELAAREPLPMSRLRAKSTSLQHGGGAGGGGSRYSIRKVRSGTVQRCCVKVPKTTIFPYVCPLCADPRTDKPEPDLRSKNRRIEAVLPGVYTGVLEASPAWTCWCARRRQARTGRGRGCCRARARGGRPGLDGTARRSPW